MKQHEIIAGRSYTNAGGRTERAVLAIGLDVPVRWFGFAHTEPKSEPGVRYVDTRHGKTFYGHRSEKRVSTMYLSAFARWAKLVVPEGDEAPHGLSASSA